MLKKLLFILPFSAVLVLFGNGCIDTSIPGSPSEQQQVTETHARQVVAVPMPQLDNSLERLNIKKRLETFDEPNKVSYIYLINYGRVMAFYTIKGKVTSGSKRLTSGEKQVVSNVDCGQYGCDNVSVMEAPELDGSYGSSAPYIYFWTTENIYVQWSSDYMLVDQPLQLSTQPELTRIVK